MVGQPAHRGGLGGHPASVAAGLVLLALLGGVIWTGAGTTSWGPDRVIARCEGGASLSVRKGVPVLHLRGTPYQMGWQQGTLLGESLRECAGRAASFWARRGGPARERQVTDAAVAVARSLPEGYRQELQGLADGAHLSYDEAAVVSFGYDGLEAALAGEAEAGAAGCSQFVVLPELTGDGVIHARNLDFGGGKPAQKLLVLIVAEPDGALPYVSLTHVGGIGVVTGMNSEGVVLAHNAVTAGFEPDGLPTYLAYRQALETCQTRDEAIELVLGTARDFGGNLVVSDPQRGAVVELSPSGGSVREPSGGWVAATNHFLETTAVTESTRRYATIRDALWGLKRPLMVDGAVDVLGRVAWTGTIQSVVFLPGSREFYVNMNHRPSPAGRFSHFTLDELFGSP